MLKLIETITEIKDIVWKAKDSGLTIGLVPTMGYLHDGHKSLMIKSSHDNDITITSVFVNPAQFGKGEDLDKYPRDLTRDMAVANNAGVDYVFYPKVSQMYPEGYDTYVSVGGVSSDLCGAKRPGHFRGVATVVLKLFNICVPTRAYFGQKDYQQAVVINKMTKELDLDIEIVVCPIVREKDGLAMSSRNVYLNEDERKAATGIYKALCHIEREYLNGVFEVSSLKETAIKELLKFPLIKTEYIEIRDAYDLTEIKEITRDAVAAIAVYAGSTRLIDNIILKGADR